MDPQDDPEKRIRELERPLADAAHASELGQTPPPGGYAYPPGPAGPPPPGPWTYGGPFPGPPPKPPSGNRMWWILGTFVVIAVIAVAGGVAAFAAHQLSGVRSTITGTVGPPSGGPSSPGPPTGGSLSVSGIGENRTIGCDGSVVSVSGVSNTVVITGHCARLTVSGVQNSIDVDAVDSIDASGFNNKVIYHSGTPKISNAGDSNVVQRG